MLGEVGQYQLPSLAETKSEKTNVTPSRSAAVFKGENGPIIMLMMNRSD